MRSNSRTRFATSSSSGFVTRGAVPGGMVLSTVRFATSLLLTYVAITEARAGLAVVPRAGLSQAWSATCCFMPRNVVVVPTTTSHSGLAVQGAEHGG
ncbi:hypothetical protein GOP47_0000878 [Adiantum capillus-veneris]|uniref:Uncharacterized protein n=1 Tax=Adiantum capillus-veneris TaxID=13818 RepID=A0A9D4VEQ5_ADICA|nr:hypothetical protein GOP47_0030786 [Adiantum capillus-veneris]KAI5084709.1 hypothetical protein GOP47_0000878 [Adiantum capillus-veneris]